MTNTNEEPINFTEDIVFGDSSEEPEIGYDGVAINTVESLILGNKLLKSGEKPHGDFETLECVAKGCSNMMRGLPEYTDPKSTKDVDKDVSELYADIIKQLKHHFPDYA
jgi:hypothetical protein